MYRRVLDLLDHAEEQNVATARVLGLHKVSESTGNCNKPSFCHVKKPESGVGALNRAILMLAANTRQMSCFGFLAFPGLTSIRALQCVMLADFLHSC